MWLRRSLSMLVLLLALGLVAGMGLVQPARAALRDGLVFRADCDGFVSRGGTLTFNRDNTGTGREQLIFTATDGNGNTIYGPQSESYFVGSTLTLPPGLFFAWSAAPTANPLFVRITSAEGNGLNAQTIYTAVGTCDALETVLETEVTVLDVLDGRTSPSVPINANVPRPTNPDNAVLGEAGYLIVNTDNLNIRSGDGPEYTVVGRVDGGTELIVLGRNENRTWFYVQIDDIIGWVLGELTIVRGDLTGVPVVPVVGEIARPTLFVFTTIGLAVVPVDNSLTICEIPGNLEYYIVGRNTRSTWFELEATCNGATVTGWVKAENGGLRNPADSFIPVTD